MTSSKAILASRLYDEATFYPQFMTDLLNCTSEVIIESPFITNERMKLLYPSFESLVKRGVKVFIFTRSPAEHSNGYETQSEEEIQRFERLGVQVFLCLGNHHRKLAIIDRKILWEGSLNILSQVKSREIVRRIKSAEVAENTFDFLKLDRFI